MPYCMQAGRAGFLAASLLAVAASPSGAQTEAPQAAPTLSTYGGTFVVKLTITVLSTIPDAQPLACSATVTASDTSFLHSYTETASTVATRSGSAASCVMTIPYLWRLGSGPTYTISYQIISESGSSLPTRYAQYSNSTPAPVPVSGSTSGRNFTVHI